MCKKLLIIFMHFISFGVIRKHHIIYNYKHLLQDMGENSMPSPNVIMQLFSPIITSQYVMASQFGNSYTSMKCQDGINVVFDEYIGYTFMYIATEEEELMKRTVGVCVSLVEHVCGPDVTLLVYIK